MYEVSKCAPQEALRDLDRAYRNFFAGQAKYPRFKRRRLGAGSFRLTGVIRVFHSSVQLPRIGIVRLKERGYLPIEGVHVLSVTVSEKAGKWFVSLHVEEEIEVLNNTGPVVGVDVGISSSPQSVTGLSSQTQGPCHAWSERRRESRGPLLEK
jgi:transposase